MLARHLTPDQTQYYGRATCEHSSALDSEREAEARAQPWGGWSLPPPLAWSKLRKKIRSFNFSRFLAYNRTNMLLQHYDPSQLSNFVAI